MIPWEATLAIGIVGSVILIALQWRKLFLRNQIGPDTDCRISLPGHMVTLRVRLRNAHLYAKRWSVEFYRITLVISGHNGTSFRIEKQLEGHFPSCRQDDDGCFYFDAETSLAEDEYEKLAKLQGSSYPQIDIPEILIQTEYLVFEGSEKAIALCVW